MKLNFYQQVNKQIILHSYLESLSYKKELGVGKCNSMDKLQKHYSRQNKTNYTI